MRSYSLIIQNKITKNKESLSKTERLFLFYMDNPLHIVYQMLEFLPERIKDALENVNINNVYEIRLRADFPTLINYLGEYKYLGSYGVCERIEQAIVCDDGDISDCVFRAGNYSVYSVEEQIKRGFITAGKGERIGLAGEYVFDKGQPLSIRNFTSLCIRVPHEIVGCGDEIFQRCMRDKVRNVLIASPPGLGKTTILRDLGRIISEKGRKNVLICDERGEIGCGNVKNGCDILKYADKATAFEAGIRAMRPDVIITDELSALDCSAVEKAVYGGVKVLASAHFSCISDIKQPFLGLFERYVILNKQKIGQIDGVYDTKGQKVD